LNEQADLIIWLDLPLYWCSRRGPRIKINQKIDTQSMIDKIDTL
jgi:hypothetical protein